MITTVETIKKEIVIAIILGIILGIGGTLFFSGKLNLKIISFEKINLERLWTNKITSSKKPKPSIIITGKLSEKDFLNIDQTNETVASSSSFLISGKTKPESKILILSETEELVTTASRDGTFTQTVTLVPGDNKIQVTNINKLDIYKEIIIYYFPVQK